MCHPWLVLVRHLQGVGLALSSPAHAAVLVQLSVALTPLLARLGGQVVPMRVWGAALVALAGGCTLYMS